MRRSSVLSIIFICLVSALCLSCAATPKEALRLTPESLKNKQIQTRVFDTSDEALVLSACAGVLQDLGFTFDETESQLGVIVASKDRSAVNTGEVILAVLAALAGNPNVAIDKNQKIRVSLVTRPCGETLKTVKVRATFQRVVWNTNNQVTRAESLTDEDIYTEFFQKLSKSLFLEAHRI